MYSKSVSHAPLITRQLSVCFTNLYLFLSQPVYASIEDIIAKLTDEMLNYARNMEFEKAAELRDKIKELENMMD